MNNARIRFWIAAALSGALWLTMMFTGGPDSAFDLYLGHLFFAGGNPVMIRNATFFTDLGYWFVLIPLAILATVFLMLRRKRRAALLLIIVFGGRFLVELQKLLLHRARPGVSPQLVRAHDSFPSGHAANSMLTFLAIALLLPVRQRNRAIAVGLGLALSLQVGASRVMLGLHWPSDVIGGWAFALLWTIVCMRLASAKPEPAPVINAPQT